MTGATIGYIRVSSFEQNPDRQLEGVKLDKRFIDKVSGRTIERPELTQLINYAREGDTIIIHSMDRLARNLDDLRRLVFLFTNNKIKVQFIKESLTFTGEDSPMANLLLSVMGGFAEFERALIKERQLEGIALAKKKGIYTGRKKALNADKITDIKQRLTNGHSKSQIARDFKISRETLYKCIREIKEDK